MPTNYTLVPQPSVLANKIDMDINQSIAVEFVNCPEVLINKAIAPLQLQHVNVTGIVVGTEDWSAFIPWSNIRAFIS